MIPLRPYQHDLLASVRNAWSHGARSVLMRLGTGGGKTVCFGQLIAEHQGASALVVHRTELVAQISLTLARLGIRHDLIAAKDTCKAVARLHVDELGRCLYQPGARCAVASVDTLVRAKGLDAWAAQVTLWICDEGHHALRDNKWGAAIGKFSHVAARGLLPTATPVRADGKGLGSHHDGFADCMVEGPPERWLIDQGYLTDYRVFCPPSDIAVAGDLPASGDFSPTQLRTAAKRSHITGDLPRWYCEFAGGQLGLSFCTDVETAVETCVKYREHGVRAEVVTGTTHPQARRDAFRRFERREVEQLCVVDIVSEGTDLPACQVGSFGRPSESLGLVRQQMGRILRPMYAPGVPLDTQTGRLEAIASGVKPHAVLIDHVQHFVKPHIGPPDRPRVWSLDRRDKRGKPPADDAIPLRVCLECFKPYERTERVCPHCGWHPVPAGRSSPEMVDGDLAEMDTETLDRLRGAVIDVDRPREAYAQELAATGLAGPYVARNTRLYDQKLEAQRVLREAMGRWGGSQRARGRTDSQMQREFWLRYGHTVLGAMALGTADATALTAAIDGTVSNR